MKRAPTKKEIRDLAADVIGSPELARDWLATPAVAFGQRKPRDMMATAEGRRMVVELLERIRWGVYT
jgi:putative toxin-antitoxin system antitoxin component (TIGR02293 family)